MISTNLCYEFCLLLNSFKFYSLPYGNTVYHLSATLHAMANPVIEININMIKIYSSSVPKKIQYLNSA